MRRVAVFGGTFDPVHCGHLAPVQHAVKVLRFDAVIFMPAGRPPHKLEEPTTAFAHRFAMLALATQAFDRFTISDLESGRRGPTYTVDTLRRLHAQRAGEDLYFLMGSDSFVQIQSWHRWRELPELARLVVLRRPTVEEEELRAAAPARWRQRLRRIPQGDVSGHHEPSDAILLLDNEPLPISATALRARFRRSEGVEGLVPDEVARYIRKHRLYRDVTHDGP